MEELKKLEELTTIDERHILLGHITGRMHSIESLHQAVSSITLHPGVPDEIIGQFNVARNMALYQYYCYSLSMEVRLKTYTVIELALKRRANSGTKLMLKALVQMAVEERWICDAGFRHVMNPQPDNPYCHNLIQVLPDLRNAAAHGSTDLTPDNVGHLEKCADFINQLFDPIPTN